MAATLIVIGVFVGKSEEKTEEAGTRKFEFISEPAI